MNRYAMTYRAGGQRCIQHIVAANLDAAYEKAFVIACRLSHGIVHGFAVVKD